MKRTVWFLGLLGLGLSALPGQAGWIVHISDVENTHTVPASYAPAQPILPAACASEETPTAGMAAALAIPADGVIPASCCLGNSCCACAEPAAGGWCRPGLLARLRQRWQERHCCSCGERPGLLERLRQRRAERRASWCAPCWCP